MATARRSRSKSSKCGTNNNNTHPKVFPRHRHAVVWEWQNDSGSWKPYSSAVSHLLERASSKGLVSAYLGDAEPSLSSFVVNLLTLLQQNQNTCPVKCYNVRRQMYPPDSIAASGFRWAWCGDVEGAWHCFAMDVQCYIEDCFKKQTGTVDLEEKFPYLPYRIDFQTMTQVNKVSGFSRVVQRSPCAAYPVTTVSSARSTPEGSEGNSTDNLSGRTSLPSLVTANPTVVPQESANGLAWNLRSRERKLSASQQDNVALTKKHLISPTCVSDTTDVTQKKKKSKSSSGRSVVDRLAAPARALASLLSSHSWTNKAVTNDADAKSYHVRRPTPYTPTHRVPVPDVKLPEEIYVVTKDALGPVEVNYVLTKYTQQVEQRLDDEDCCICCERLSSASAYDDSTTVVSLQLCSHQFHQSCLEAMYNSGLKDGCIQCPTCKLIHGIKYGNQPEGKMDYYVEDCSLPDYADCGTVCINYYITAGIQGPDHPVPGSEFSARGFPRRCYLPDNVDGRKVLRLLVTAWERRLIFTIGSSSTTGEPNTVTWNEIHHKTEFGSNWSGHGFPDPQYISNVLQELALQGVVE